MNRTSGQTLRIASALAWEFWARGRYWLLLAPLCAALIPGIFFGSMLAEHGLNSLRGIQGIEGFHLLFYWIAILSFIISLLATMENPGLRYTLPASSVVLVAAPMACAMATVFAQYAIVAIILNTLFEAGWSIWGPGLIATVLIALCHVVQWSTWHSGGLRSSIWLTGALLILFAICWWETYLGPQKGGFLDRIDGQLVIKFILAMLACVGAGVLGFSMLRHGGGTDLTRVAEWFRRRVPLGTEVRRTLFSSPQAAQFWLEWMERGWALPCCYAMIGIGATLLELFMPLRYRGNSLGMGTVLCFLQLIWIGLFWGSRSRRFEFRSFQGSRPLSDSQLASAILKSAAVGLIAAALIWIAFTALYDLVLRRERGSFWGAPFRSSGAWVVLAEVTVVVTWAWSATGLVTSLVLAGKKAMGIGFGLVFGVALASFLAPLCFPERLRADIREVYWNFWHVIFLFGCGATFLASWRRRLISKQTLWLAAVLVLAIAFMEIAKPQFAHSYLPWKAVLSTFAWCALIPIPLAAAPLAVYVNRHR